MAEYPTEANSLFNIVNHHFGEEELILGQIIICTISSI